MDLEKGRKGMDLGVWMVGLNLGDFNVTQMGKRAEILIHIIHIRDFRVMVDFDMGMNNIAFYMLFGISVIVKE